MSAHVLLNLQNELGKKTKCKFYKLNNIGGPMLDSIYHMTYDINSILKSYFLCAKFKILPYIPDIVTVITWASSGENLS